MFPSSIASSSSSTLTANTTTTTTTISSLYSSLNDNVTQSIDGPLAKALEKCQQEVLSAPPIDPTLKYCPRAWDGWGCWNDTPPGQTAYIPCPIAVVGFRSDQLAFKLCLEDGNWFRHPDTNKTWSNYTTCVDKDDLKFRQAVNNLYIIGYSVSVLALIISLIIFLSFKSLKCTRITIHKNLFISFIINNLMWILWYTLVVSDVEVVQANRWYCQLLHVLVHYFLLANYSWTFCEGLYLHTLLVVAFVAEEKIMKWFYVIGWGVPLIFIGFYAGFRGLSYNGETNYCWIDESKYSWWYTGPVLVSFVLNLFFLVNIVRVLVTKMRAVNSPDAHQTRKAVKATLILLPLLGLHFLVTPFRPPEGTHAEEVYEIVAALVASLQGLCVAILFCFCNGEVISQFKKRWTQIALTHGDNRRMSYAATSVSGKVVNWHHIITKC
ncbi:calcitonin gene-related peptide type 1 receptor-like isoform X2 [Panonychus citri]|uniref:calcitonin gene-related peptide type 1 receptor-like isoform X2 n=1 Tax=Panonychus citri TaxID=50023 RepID=UPI0023079EE4|nr:calcitonin gene-related peptide type 1 receptor-like isoform X2 [Panonychus citri]